MTTDRLLTIHYGVAEPAPAAPTFFSASTAAGAVSYTTQ